MIVLRASAAIALAVAAALILTALWAWILPSLPAAAPASDVAARRTALARFARSALFFVFAAFYWFFLRRARPPFLEATGFVPAKGAGASYSIGFVAGVLPVVALIAVLVALGARSFEIRASAGTIAWLAARAVALGFGLVLVEEGLFRGLVQGDLARAFGARVGLIAGAAFFAGTHFLGAPEAWRALPDPAPGAPEVVAAVFGGFERLLREWPEFVGLFLVGVVLAILRLRSGALWLGMGVHAGWYWIKTIDRWFVRDVDAAIDANRLVLGTSQYLDGVVGWLALLATLVLALTIRLPTGRSPGPERRVP
jgi:membrane protease YdiL (CAAX protease family)